MGKRKNVAEVQSPRAAALRRVAERRIERLLAQEEKLKRHLETERGKGDIQALHHLLHKVEVELHDTRRNLTDPEWVPKPQRKPSRTRPKRTIGQLLEPTREKGSKPTDSRYALPAPVPLPAARRTDDVWNSKSNEIVNPRIWSSAPYVEVDLRGVDTDAVRAYLEKFKIEDDKTVVRNWAIEAFGSIAEAREALRESARVPTDAEIWRQYLEGTRRKEEYDALNDEELLQNARARRDLLFAHKRDWVKNIGHAICNSKAAKGKSKDALFSQVSAHLKSFHTAVNSGKHTNPQMSYLTAEKGGVSAESVTEDVLLWLEQPLDQRFEKDKEDTKKRGKLTIHQKALGAARRAKHWRGTEKSLPWSGREVVSGTVARRREGAVLWDKKSKCLVCALITGSNNPLDVNRYVFLSGDPPDNQIMTAKGKGKSAIVMPLIPKHDFLRWYEKHVENDNADGDLHRRCVQNSFSFKLILPDGKRPMQLFIRPILSFFNPPIEVPDTHSFYAQPKCRYLIGVDRGINYPYRAVVVDKDEMKVILDDGKLGRKREWEMLRKEMAYWQSVRDTMRNQGKDKGKPFQRMLQKIRLLRKKERGLNAVATVEAIAQLVQWAETNLGPGNYCFVLEDLSSNLNLKRNNRVKNIAMIKDALVHQMRKRGYKFNERSGKVDGVREESAWYTSQISPSGWWAKTDEVEAAYKADKSRPIGRLVGRWYAYPEGPVEGDTLYPRGEFRVPQNEEGKKHGKPRFFVGEKVRRNFGSELFWDPHCIVFAGRSFPEGVVLDADFVGAFNIALRPLVKDGQGKGFDSEAMALAHTQLNPKFKVACPVKAYKFVPLNGDPRGALQPVTVGPPPP